MGERTGVNVGAPVESFFLLFVPLIFSRMMSLMRRSWRSACVVVVIVDESRSRSNEQAVRMLKRKSRTSREVEKKSGPKDAGCAR